MGAAELLELQRLDDRLSELRGEREAVAARLLGSSELARARTTLDEIRREHDEDERLVRARELEAVTLRDRARRLDTQLYGGSVRNPTELLALQRELAELRERIAVEEDAELELMERAETAAAAVTEAEQALVTVEGARAAQAAPDRERLVALDERIADTVAERELAATRRTSAELRLYERVGAHHRPAVTRVVEDRCGGCRMPLGMSEVHAVRSRQGIVQCSTCDRILAP